MRWLLPLVVIAALTGCNSKPTTTVEQPLNTKVEAGSEPGWSLAKNEKEGVSMQMPPGWIAMDLSSGDLDKIMGNMAKDNPNLAAMRAQIQQLAASGIYKMFLMEDPGDKPKDFTNNVNVIVIDAPGATLEQAEKEAKAATGAGDVTEMKRVNLPQGEALRVVRSLPINLPGGKKITCHVIQYQMVAKDKAHILSFSSSDADAAKLSPTFEKMMKTYKTG